MGPAKAAEKGACKSSGVPLHIHAPHDLECGGSCRRVSSYKSSVTSEMISLCMVRYGGLYAHKPSFEGCFLNILLAERESYSPSHEWR